MFFLQYKNRALGCSLCYRQNIDKPQLSSVSGTIFKLQVPILGSGSLILQKWGAVIDSSTMAVPGRVTNPIENALGDSALREGRVPIVP